MKAKELFLLDAARWVHPGEGADLSELSGFIVVKLLYSRPPLRALGWFRLANLFQHLGIKGVPGYLQRRILRLYGLDLTPEAQIGGGLYIAHPVGCTLVVESIGTNVTIMGSNTLGRRSEKSWPTIGDDSFIGTGARIIGGVTIGAGAVIGANAVVLTDIAPGACAVGVPARVID